MYKSSLTNWPLGLLNSARAFLCLGPYRKAAAFFTHASASAGLGLGQERVLAIIVMQNRDAIIMTINLLDIKPSLAEITLT